MPLFPQLQVRFLEGGFLTESALGPLEYLEQHPNLLCMHVSSPREEGAHPRVLAQGAKQARTVMVNSDQSRRTTHGV